MTEPRRRTLDQLPGEATLAGMLPKGWTLLLIIGTGVAYASWAWFQISANAEAVAKILPKVAATARTTSEIKTEQLLMRQKLEDFLEVEAERRALAAARDAAIRGMLQQLILQGSEGPR